MNSINNLNSSSNVQFTGISLAKKATINQRKDYVDAVSNMLHQDKKDIFKLIENASTKRIILLEKLANRYNQDNFYRQTDKEDSTLVNKIYKIVTSPKNDHFSLISNFKGSLNSLYRIFTDIDKNNKRKSLAYARKVNNEILSKNKNVHLDLIPELLESPNSKEYVKNYSKYESYLKLNCNNKDAVKNLDEMVTNKTYHQKKYDILYKNKELRSTFRLPETEVFNSEHFVENYSDAGRNFLEYMVTHFRIDKELLAAGADEVLFDMFKTSTDKNIKQRIEIMQRFPNIHVHHKNTEQQVTQFNELKQLFDTVDRDPYARKFLQKFLKNPIYNSISINNINKILSDIPSAKLAIFYKNAKNILSQVSKEEQINTLQTELENPFFETKMTKDQKKKKIKYGLSKEISFLQKLMTKIENKINILKFKHFESKHPSVPEEVKSKTAQPIVAKASPVKTQEVKKAIETPQIKEEVQAVSPVEARPVEKATEKTTAAETKTAQSATETTAVSAAETAAAKLKEKVEPENIKPTAKKKTNKEEIKKNIFEIISSKLGPKTYAKQQDAFGAYATKIRLSLLPEIFASVADTRKADRAVGKYRINSSNKDVLDLYLLINGNNKKFANYLLKKRNTDNSRMFEVKDIIQMLKKAEAKIQKDKQTNPEYRARDARKYYNHLYESKIQQYGKLKRQPKSLSTKA